MKLDGRRNETVEETGVDEMGQETKRDDAHYDVWSIF